MSSCSGRNYKIFFKALAFIVNVIFWCIISCNSISSLLRYFLIGYPKCAEYRIVSIIASYNTLSLISKSKGFDVPAYIYWHIWNINQFSFKWKANNTGLNKNSVNLIRYLTFGDGLLSLATQSSSRAFISHDIVTAFALVFSKSECFHFTRRHFSSPEFYSQVLL